MTEFLREREGSVATSICLDLIARIKNLGDRAGRLERVRLNRGGNRRMNASIHRIAITQKRTHPPAQDYLAARRALGNSNTEAIRALKRHLARRLGASGE